MCLYNLYRTYTELSSRSNKYEIQNRRPAPFNVVPSDTEGITWALPEGAIARLGKGNFREVKSSPNGTYFAVATGIGLWWYEMSSSAPIALWETERGMISAVDFSQDGEWIAIANYDGIIKVVDIQSGECLAQMKRTEEHNVYWHIDFSPDSKWIATANFSGIVEVLDVHQGNCVAQMDQGNRKAGGADIYRLEFSPNGKYVAGTADVDTEGTQTYIWCPETGKLIFKFAGRNFSFSQDSCLLAGVTFDEPIGDADPINHYISVWNITTGERISHFSVKSAWMDTIIFSPCGEFLAFSSRDEILSVWDITRDEQERVYPDFQTSRTVPFYSTEGELFAIVDRQDTIEVWNMDRREKTEIPELHPMEY